MVATFHKTRFFFEEFLLTKKTPISIDLLALFEDNVIENLSNQADSMKYNWKRWLLQAYKSIHSNSICEQLNWLSFPHTTEATYIRKKYGETAKKLGHETTSTGTPNAMKL